MWVLEVWFLGADKAPGFVQPWRYVKVEGGRTKRKHVLKKHQKQWKQWKHDAKWRRRAFADDSKMFEHNAKILPPSCSKGFKFQESMSSMDKPAFSTMTLAGPFLVPQW